MQVDLVVETVSNPRRPEKYRPAYRFPENRAELHTAQMGLEALEKGQERDSVQMAKLNKPPEEDAERESESCEPTCSVESRAYVTSNPFGDNW